MRLSGVDFIYPVLFGLMIFVGYRLYRRATTAGRLERMMIATMPVAFFLFVARVVQEMLSAPFQIWDTVRLLPAYLLSKGFPIYYSPDSGPLLDQMYGPMTAVAYLPVTWLTQSPAWAASIAKIFTVTYFFGPMFLIAYLQAPARRAERVLVYYGLLATLFFALTSPVLSGSGFWNHADAPALGWCALGCIVLYMKKEKEHWLWMAGSALCVFLSIWTKQVTAPLIIALPLYLWFADGLRCALRYALALLVVGLLVSAVFVYVHGLQNLWFNLIYNPACEPWQTDLVKIQGLAIVELMIRARWMVVLQAAYLFFDARRYPMWGRWRKWFDENRWVLFTLVGFCMVPTSLMGRMKVGGDMNALSFTMYFLLMATFTLFIRIVHFPPTSPDYRAIESFGRKIVFAFVISAMVIQLPTVSYALLRLSRTMSRLQINPATVAYVYDRQHPGEVYMPWNCLETFLAEGKIYHFEYAVFDRNIADLHVSPQHFRDGLPSGMKYIAYPANEQARHVMSYFPEYSQEVKLPELPGWTVYSRDTPRP